jgi:hypothetical protein
MLKSSSVPFQNCVRQRRPVSKMATITKNRNFFKWPKLLYFKPESAQIWTDFEKKIYVIFIAVCMKMDPFANHKGK